MHKQTLLLILLVLSVSLFAQQPSIQILTTGKRVSFRGLCAVSDSIVWASGSSGMVAKSVDGGNTWVWVTVPGYEKRDFRDIEAFDEKTAIIMAIAEPAVILKTTDGGQHWKTVFEDTTKGMFLDAMAFNKNGIGGVVGDPVNDSVFFALTTNWGETWKKLNIIPKPNDGEAFFASSGTNIHILDNQPILVSGGKSSRIVSGNEWFYLPIMQGGESTGANSIAVYSNTKAVVVGGDFSKDTLSTDNCVLIRPKFGKSWRQLTFTKPQTPPHGYRSCVIYLNEKNLITCGTSGIDISIDGGKNWKLISKENFHVCHKAKKGKVVFLAGNGGRIAKLKW